MRLALPTLLALSVLPAAAAQRHPRTAALHKGQDGTPRRRAAKAEEREKKHYTVGDLRVHVSPKSGEIAVSREKMGKKRDKASTVTILVKSIREVDADGDAVGDGAGEAEAHSFASLRDTEFEVAVEEYDVPIEIEDDAEVAATEAAEGSAADADGGEPDTGVDVIDAVDEEAGETETVNDIVDTAGEAGEGEADLEYDTEATATASSGEVTDSAGSDRLRRHLEETNTTPSPVTEEAEGSGELDEEEEQGDENADAVAPTPATEGGAEGANVTISAPLQTESAIRIEMWLISGGGAVGTTSEQWAVQPGDAKFNIQLTRWAFCDPCADGTGEFVDVQLQVKGKNGPKPKEKGARIEDADRKGGKGKKDGSDEQGGKKGKKQRKEHAYDLGEGTTLDLTSAVRVDGVWETMPEGFPKLVNKGGKQYYTLRFPKFADNIWYDPVVTYDEDYDSSAATSRFVGHTALCGAMLLAYSLL